jgi:CheY-like chemotaxis protein
LNGLAGRKVLIVEDEPVISMLLEDWLDQLGVGIAGVAETLDEAREAAQRDGFDAAILDVNLRGDMSYPAAEVLARRGIPLVFVSGYAREAVPQGLENALFLAKPYNREQIGTALAKVLGVSEAA